MGKLVFDSEQGAKAAQEKLFAYFEVGAQSLGYRKDALGIVPKDQTGAERPEAQRTERWAEPASEDDGSYTIPAPSEVERVWIEKNPAMKIYFEGQVVRFDEAGEEVSEGGTEYRSTIPFNVWSPDAYPRGWELVEKPAGPQPWVQPQGAHDAYRLGAFVTFGGRTWENTGSDANVWEPGVFGWTVVT